MSPKEMDTDIAALEKQLKIDEGTPFVIWGMGNETPSGYSYSIHIPERNGNEMINSPTYDLLSVKVGWEWMEQRVPSVLSLDEAVKMANEVLTSAVGWGWMEEKRNQELLSQEEQLKMANEVIDAGKKLAGIE